jgi:hypothetical protein
MTIQTIENVKLVDSMSHKGEESDPPQQQS